MRTIVHLLGNVAFCFLMVVGCTFYASALSIGSIGPFTTRFLWPAIEDAPYFLGWAKHQKVRY